MSTTTISTEDRIRSLENEVKELKNIQSESPSLGPRILTRAYCSYCYMYGTQQWKDSHRCTDAVENAKENVYKQLDELVYGEPERITVREYHNVTLPNGTTYSESAEEGKARAIAENRAKRASIDAHDRAMTGTEMKIPSSYENYWMQMYGTPIPDKDKISRIKQASIVEEARTKIPASYRNYLYLIEGPTEKEKEQMQSRILSASVTEEKSKIPASYRNYMHFIGLIK